MEALRVLVIGDVVGQPGLRVLFVGLKALVSRTRADLVIANGENAADGRGMTSFGRNAKSSHFSRPRIGCYGPKTILREFLERVTAR